MENLQYSKILSKNWELIALVTGLAVILALVISLVSPFQYSASTKLLIIQKQEQNLDAYTATKSAETIGKNLSSIIFTSSFYNDVIDANPTLQNKFPSDPIERRKAWDKNIEVNIAPDSGILEISAYDTDRNFASELVRSIAYDLVNKGSEYHGGGTGVEIKVVDDAFISKYPVRPNIFLNLGIALIVGILLGSYWVILRAARKIQKNREASPEYLPAATADETDSKGYSIEYATAKSFGFETEDSLPESPRIITMYDHLK